MCEGYATSFKWKSFKGMPKDAAPNEKPHKQDFEYHGRTPVAASRANDVRFEAANFVADNTSNVMFAPYHNYASTIVVDTRKRGSGEEGGGEGSVKRRVMSEGGGGKTNAIGPRHRSVDVSGGLNGVSEGLLDGAAGAAGAQVISGGLGGELLDGSSRPLDKTSGLLNGVTGAQVISGGFKGGLPKDHQFIVNESAQTGVHQPHQPRQPQQTKTQPQPSLLSQKLQLGFVKQGQQGQPQSQLNRQPQNHPQLNQLQNQQQSEQSQQSEQQHLQSLQSHQQSTQNQHQSNQPHHHNHVTGQNHQNHVTPQNDHLGQHLLGQHHLGHNQPHHQNQPHQHNLADSVNSVGHVIRPGSHVTGQADQSNHQSSNGLQTGQHNSGSLQISHVSHQTGHVTNQNGHVSHPTSHMTHPTSHMTSYNHMTNPNYAYVSVPPPMDDYYTRISRLFDHHTCGIVTIKDGPSDNPWRTSLWPLAQHNPVLYHAIAAMTLFHTARGNIEIRREAFSHMRDSIQLLASGISSLQPHVALATTLSLAFAESWDQHITTGMLHLRGSKPLVKGLLAKYNRRLPSWLLFLYNSYVYLDVLARLTSSGDIDEDDVLEIENVDMHVGSAGEDPLDIAHVISADLVHFQQQLSSDLATSPPSSVVRPLAHDMHPPGAADGIDPLLGCAQTLFPVIGKIGTLANRVARFEADSTSVSQASMLMRLLQQWRPATAVQYFVNDPDWDLRSCLNTAEAYRYAAMIHLVQAVPQVQTEPLPVTTQRVLRLLEDIPTSSRTCTTHIFPLLVAGCEAQGSQRHFVKRRWESLAVRLWIGNVDRAVEVMEEVWRQRDRMGWRGEPVGVTSPAYWSQVMKNWRWEVLLG